MPIATVGLSNGKEVKFYVPEGTTDQQAAARAPAMYGLALDGVDVLAPPRPKEKTLGGYLGEVPRGLAGGVAGLIESAATGASFLLPEEQEQATRAAIARTGDSVQDFLGPKPGYEDSVISKLSQATGSTLPLLGLAALGPFGIAAGVGTGIAAGSGEAANRATVAGEDEETISTAAGFGMIPGALEFFPPAAIIKRFRKVAGKEVTDYALKRVRNAAAEEGVQEGVSTVAQNLISKGLYDPETGVFTGTGESIGYGAGVGGLLQLLMELAPGKNRGRPRLERDTEGPTVEQTAADGEFDLNEVGDIAGMQDDAIDVLQTQATPLDNVAATPEELAILDAFDSRDAPAPTEELTDEQITGLMAASPETFALTPAATEQEIPAVAPNDQPVSEQEIATVEADQTPAALPVPEEIAELAARDVAQFGVTPAYAQNYEAREAEIRETDEEGADAYRQEVASLTQTNPANPVSENQAQPVATQAPIEQAPIEQPVDGVERAGEAFVVPKETIAQSMDTQAKTVTSMDRGLIGNLLGSTKPGRSTKANPRTPEQAATYYFNKPADFGTTVRMIAYDIDNADTELQRGDAQRAFEWVNNNLSDATIENLDSQRAEFSKLNSAISADQAAKAEERDTARANLAAEVDRQVAPERDTARDVNTQADEIMSVFEDERTQESVADKEARLAPMREEVINNLQSDKEFYFSRNDLEDMDTVLDEYGDSLLPKDAALASSQPVDPTVLQALRDGNIVEALTRVASTTTNPQVKDLATGLSMILGGVKVRVQEGLTSVDGKPAAGLFDAQTNTITLDPANLRNHTLLHEATHAAVDETLNNPAHPFTKKMKALFEAAAPFLSSAYGTTSLKEFAAEAKSNPEFQSELASIRISDSHETVWDRMLNNIRSLLGLKGKPVETVDSRAQDLLNSIIPSSIRSQGAPAVSAAAATGQGAQYANQIGKTFKGDNTEAIYDDSINTLKAWINNTKSTSRKGALNILPLPAIAGMYKDTVPSVEKLYFKLKEMTGNREAKKRKINDIANRLNGRFKNDPAGRKEFNTIVHWSTRAKVDPSQPRDRYEKFWVSYTDPNTGKEVTVSKTKEVDRDVIVTQLRKDGTPFEIYGGDAEQLAIYDEMQKSWNSSPMSKYQDAYKELRDAYKEIYVEMVDSLVKRVEDTGLDATAKKGMKARLLREMLAKDKIEPFFPLYRKGDYWLTFNSIDPTTDTVEPVKQLFGTRAERDRAAGRVNRDPALVAAATKAINQASQGYPGGATAANIDKFLDIQTNTNSETKPYRKLMGNESSVLLNLLDMLSKGSVGTPPVDQGVLDRITEAMLDLAPERSMLSALRKREGILGFEEDALTVFREKGNLLANQTSTTAYSRDIDVIQRDIQAEVSKRKTAINSSNMPRAQKDNLNASVEELQQVTDGFVNFSRNPFLHKYSRMVRTGVFALTLGFNVSSAAVNATNLPIVVYPALIARFNAKDATKALGSALTSVLGTGFSRNTENFSSTPQEVVKAAPSLMNIDFANPDGLPTGIEPHHVHLTDTMRELGDANRTMATDVLESGDVSTPIWSKMSAWMGLPLGLGERINRQISTLAHFNLAADKAAKAKKTTADKLSPDELRQIAKEAVQFTDMTNSTAEIETSPRFSQGNVGSVLMMYRKFGVTMYFLQTKMALDIYRGISPQAEGQRILDAGGTQAQAKEAVAEAVEAKRVAIRQAVGTFGTSALLAGVQGVPLYGAVSLAMNTWLELFGDDEEEDADTIIARFVSEGPYSGLLNYVTGADVAPRIALSRLLFHQMPNRESEGPVMTALETLGGPAVGVAGRLDTFARNMANGDFRRATESIMPSAIANPMRAWRYNEDGAAVSVRGDPIAEIATPQLFLQAMGFAPANYIKQLEINSVSKRIDRNLNQRRSKLLRNLNIARRMGDNTAYREARQLIREFNRRNPKYRVGSDTISKSRDQFRVLSRKMATTGGVSISNRGEAEARRRNEEMSIY